MVHFEEPCPYWELGWTAEVARALDLDVAGGEQDCLLSSWRQIVEQRAVDIVQPDVCYVGGFTRALAVAEMAAEAGLPCVPHSANLSLVTVFALHLLAVVPNAGPYVEYSIEGLDYYPWQDGLFTPPLEVTRRPGSAPEGPGWGVEIAPEWLARAQHRTTATYCVCSALSVKAVNILERRAGRAARRGRLPSRGDRGRAFGWEPNGSARRLPGRGWLPDLAVPLPPRDRGVALRDRRRAGASRARGGAEPDAG